MHQSQNTTQRVDLSCSECLKANSSNKKKVELSMKNLATPE